jgi:hypothetical protein
MLGFIQVISKKLSEKLNLITGLNSIEVLNGTISTYTMIEELECIMEEKLIEQKILKATSEIKLEQGYTATLDLVDVLGAGYDLYISAPEIQIDNVLGHVVEALDIYAEHFEDINSYNNSICVKNIRFVFSKEEKENWIQSQLQQAFSLIKTALEEEKSISGFEMIGDGEIMIHYPISDHIGEICKETITIEISKYLEHIGVDNFERILKQSTYDGKKYYFLNKGATRLGLTFLSGGQGKLLISGAIYKDKNMVTLGEIFISPNNILVGLDQEVNCDLITEAMPVLMENLERNSYLF